VTTLVRGATEELDRSRRVRKSAVRSSLVALVVGCLVALVLVLSVRLHAAVGPLGIDMWVERHLVARLPRSGVLTAGKYGWIARVGAPGFVAVVTLLAVGWAVRRRDAGAVLLAILGPGLALALAELVIKPAVARKIHTGDPISIFPSGTVAVAAACAATASILVMRWYGPVYATLSALLLGGVVLVVCAAVLELGWHYATDVMGAFAVAGAAVLVAAEVVARIEQRRARVGSSPPDAF
jgi:membrane-associated phospholipid phosphatase